jgi:cytochrome P450
VKDGPGNDLISMLVYNTKAKMTPEDYISSMILLVTGGNDTTRSTIAGSIVGLNKFPDQYQLLRDDHDKIPSAVNEFIRWQTPIHCVRRTAMQDTELQGKAIKKGDRVIMWYGSANYDEEKFDKPYDLIVDRKDGRHLSFGHGRHHCIGSKLAEMQVKCLWEALLNKYPNVEVVGEPVRVRSNIVAGYKRVPVRIKA